MPQIDILGSTVYKGGRGMKETVGDTSFCLHLVPASLGVPATPTASSQAVMLVPCDPTSLGAADWAVGGDPNYGLLHQPLRWPTGENNCTN